MSREDTMAETISITTTYQLWVPSLRADAVGLAALDFQAIACPQVPKARNHQLTTNLIVRFFIKSSLLSRGLLISLNILLQCRNSQGAGLLVLRDLNESNFVPLVWIQNALALAPKQQQENPSTHHHLLDMKHLCTTRRQSVGESDDDRRARESAGSGVIDLREFRDRDFHIMSHACPVSHIEQKVHMGTKRPWFEMKPYRKGGGRFIEITILLQIILICKYLYFNLQVTMLGRDLFYFLCI